jgi:hypothetical protein
MARFVDIAASQSTHRRLAYIARDVTHAVVLLRSSGNNDELTAMAAKR